MSLLGLPPLFSKLTHWPSSIKLRPLSADEDRLSRVAEGDWMVVVGDFLSKVEERRSSVLAGELLLIASRAPFAPLGRLFNRPGLPRLPSEVRFKNEFDFSRPELFLSRVPVKEFLAPIAPLSKVPPRELPPVGLFPLSSVLPLKELFPLSSVPLPPAVPPSFSLLLVAPLPTLAMVPSRRPGVEREEAPSKTPILTIFHCSKSTPPAKLTFLPISEELGWVA